MYLTATAQRPGLLQKRDHDNEHGGVEEKISYEIQSSILDQSFSQTTTMYLILHPMVIINHDMRRQLFLILAPNTRRRAQSIPKNASKTQCLMMGPIQTSFPSHSSPSMSILREYLKTVEMVATAVITSSTKPMMKTDFCKESPQTVLIQGSPHMVTLVTQF